MPCAMGYGTGMAVWSVVIVLGAVLAVVAIGIGIALLARSAMATSKPADVGVSGATRLTSTARELLDERFAKGEIDEEEYKRRKAVLESSS